VRGRNAVFPCHPFAQSSSAPPIPIWSGEGSVPAGYGNRKVFLTPDEHSVIILWPNPDGTERRRPFDLHNSIDPNLLVHMENSSGSFRYTYDHRFQFVSSQLVQIGPGIPLERRPESLVGWMYPDEKPLMPSASTNFTLVTEARPGFTSASTEHFPHLDLTDEWPEEILDQVGPGSILSGSLTISLPWVRRMARMKRQYGSRPTISSVFKSCSAYIGLNQTHPSLRRLLRI
jgi:hypothetical protein